MAPKEEVPMCPICCENSKKQVECPVCEAKCCSDCVRRYLTSQLGDAQCMSCHAVWDRDVMERLLPKCFINGDFKRHREQILFDQARAMLPTLQGRAQVVRAVRVLEEINGDINKRIYALQKEARELRLEANENSQRIAFMQRTGQVLAPDAMVNRQVVNAGAGTSREPPKFMRGCPGADCRGFLSHTIMEVNSDKMDKMGKPKKVTMEFLKCGVCEGKCCKDCHEPLKEGHECKKEDVETAKLLMKDTRPCPKCSVPIYKVNGCDQMWCTSCHTTFSWNTGEIVVGNVHNPHYYEWMRRTHGAVPRAPGDIPPGARRCEDIVPMGTLIGWLRPLQNRIARPPDASLSKEKKTEKLLKNTAINTNINRLFNVHRNVVHILHVEIPRYRAPAGNQNPYETALVDYLLNEISEDDLKLELQRKEKAIQKQRAICQILQMVTSASNDVMYTFMDAHPQPKGTQIQELVTQLENLRQFATDALLRVAKVFDCVPPVIDDTWSVMSMTIFIRNKEEKELQKAIQEAKDKGLPPPAPKEATKKTRGRKPKAPPAPPAVQA